MKADPLLRGRAGAALGTIAVLALLSRSGSGAGVDAPAIEITGPRPRYTRELLFVGERDGGALVVLFQFAAVEDPEGVARSTLAWLARDSVWDQFLDETPSTSTGGVWRILPRPFLQVLAGGATEIQVLVYRRDGRALKLRPGETSSAWSRTTEGRFRAMEAQVRLAAETTQGYLLETHRVERQHAPRYQHSALLTDTAGTLLHVVDAEPGSSEGDDGFLWSWNGHSEPQVTSGADIETVGTRRLQPSGVEIPTRWHVRLRGSGAYGELTALGHEMVEEKVRGSGGGLSVRYTVGGWIHDESGRREVKGTMRASLR